MSGVRLKLLLLTVLSLLLVDRASPLVASSPAAARGLTTANAFARLPIQFTANDGQFDDRIRFVGRKGRTQVALTDDGATVLVSTQKKAKKEKGHRTSAAPETSAPIVVGMKVAGGRAVTPRASNMLEGKSNYYLGKDPSKWRTGVASYARVEYPSVKDGVDLVYHGENGAMEYDFVVAPGTPVDGLAMEVEGASELSLDEKGDLRIHTPNGDIKQPRPIVYQRTPGGQKELVAASYQIVDKTKIGFVVASYDRSRDLVIDPTLGPFGYSTLVGGTSSDEVEGLAVDLSGNAYVTGSTFSSNAFPLSDDAFDDTLGDGESTASDVFVTKLNSNGSAFLYSTYFGGSSYDGGAAIAVDGAGKIYFTGFTESTDFPTSPGAYCQTLPFIEEDAGFAARLNADGTLGYSTFLAGSGPTFSEGRGIAVDSTGIAYVAGTTEAVDFPIPTPIIIIGDDDDAAPPGNLGLPQAGEKAFIVQIAASGNAVGYHLLADGNSTDQGAAVALDSSNHAYLAGSTSSTNLGTPACTTGQNTNALLAKVNTAGDGFEYIRCFGGDSTTDANAVAVDAAGSAYVAGRTFSSNFPTTGGAWQAAPAIGEDGFVAKFDATGANIVFATLLGGTSFDEVNGVALDPAGNIWVVGETGSGDFHAPPPIFGPNNGEGFCERKTALVPVDSSCLDDAFVGRLNPGGSNLGLFTFLGSDSDDSGQAIAVQATSVYAGGFEDGSDFPVSNGAADTSWSESEEGWVTKIGVAPLFINPSQVSVPVGTLQLFNATGGVGFGYVFTMTSSPSGGTVTPDGHYTAGNVAGGAADVVTVTDAAGLTASANIAVTNGGVTTDLVIQPANTSVSPKGQKLFTASGGTPPYAFSFASNASVGTINPAGGYTAGPNGGVTDIVRVTDAIGNSRTATIAVGPPITILPAKPTAPPGGSVTFTASGGSGGGYLWSISKNSSSGSIVQTSGRYTAGNASNVVDTVKVVDSLGNSATVQVSVGGGLAINPDAPTTTTKGTVSFTALGGSGSYSWSFASNLSGGTLDAATGDYQAGTTGDVVDLVKVTDTLGKAAVAQVTVGPALTITPNTANTLTGGKVNFTAAGGSGAGYAFTIPTNASGGAVDASGAYTAGTKAGADTVHLTDSLGNTADATVNVAAAPGSGGGGGGAGTGNGNGTGNGQNPAVPAGLNLGGGGNDDCNCRAAGAGSSVPSTPRILAGLALALGLVIRRRRRA